MHELEARFFAEFGDEFGRALCEASFLARRDAKESVFTDFARSEAENIYGFHVRAKLEGLLRSAADRFGYAGEVFKQPGQPWNHTEVSSTNFVLTAASVRSPLAMVDPADYRVGLARTGQGQLASLEDVPSDTRVYAILTHCRWLENDFDHFGHLPQSVHLVFPAADFRCYVHDINLMVRYPQVVAKYVPKDWSENAVVKYIERSRRTAFQ